MHCHGTCLHMNAAWPHAHAHTRCAPCALSQLGCQGVTPLKSTLGLPNYKPCEVCDVARASFAKFQLC